MTHSIPAPSLRRLSAEWLATLPRRARKRILKGLSDLELRVLWRHWPFWARADQLPPEDPGTGDWTTWVLLGGRGAGKTRAGAEWIRAQVEGRTPLSRGRYGHIALVAQTYQDARDVMVEGPSGLLAIADALFRPRFEPSKRLLTWPNGARARLYSDEDPERLRGPQFDGAWLDEFAKWRHAQQTLDMLQFGLRLGERPRQVVTTTPRPGAPLRALLAQAHTVVTRATTGDNADNLAPGFLEVVLARYHGTRLGRQEIGGELIDDRSDGLWQIATIEAARIRTAPELTRIVVAIDPPAGATAHSDACGIVVAGIDARGEGYVLADRSVQGLSPTAWAREAVAAYRRFEADRIVAEVNQGGAMVRTVIEQVDRSVPVRSVHATRSKQIRAEPVAALYEQGRVHHVGLFAELEDELVAFGRGEMTGSPDRVDALVWALSDLMISGTRAEPRIRAL